MITEIFFLSFNTIPQVSLLLTKRKLETLTNQKNYFDYQNANNQKQLGGDSAYMKQYYEQAAKELQDMRDNPDIFWDEIINIAGGEASSRAGESVWKDCNF